MIRLPFSLLRRLEKLFPKVADRERFVTEAVEDALRQSGTEEPSPAESIGGTLHLYTDGGSRGNPGEAAIGCVLLDPLSGKVLQEYKEAIGIYTNNVAEYKALIRGLELAQRYHPNRLICHLDSELIVKQLSGEYRVKMPSLQPLFEEIQTITDACKEVSFCHIPREKNARADRLVNAALDSKRA